MQDAEDTMGGPVKFNRWVYRQLQADGGSALANTHAVPIVWAPSVVSAESRELRSDIVELKAELEEARYEVAELQAEIDAAAKAAGRASADKLGAGVDLTEDNGPFASLFMPVRPSSSFPRLTQDPRLPALNARITSDELRKTRFWWCCLRSASTVQWDGMMMSVVWGGGRRGGLLQVVQPKKKKKRRRKGQAEESDEDKPREQPVLDLFHSMPSVAKTLPPGLAPPEAENPEERGIVTVRVVGLEGGQGGEMVGEGQGRRERPWKRRRRR
jgi:hypothetical protein